MKIRIETRDGDVSVINARPVELFGFKVFGVHRELEWDLRDTPVHKFRAAGENFIVTHSESGLKIAEGRTAKETIEAATKRIEAEAEQRAITPAEMLKRVLDHWAKDPTGVMARARRAAGP